jgi:hypothetical protein
MRSTGVWTASAHAVHETRLYVVSTTFEPRWPIWTQHLEIVAPGDNGTTCSVGRRRDQQMHGPCIGLVCATIRLLISHGRPAKFARLFRYASCHKVCAPSNSIARTLLSLQPYPYHAALGATVRHPTLHTGRECVSDIQPAWGKYDFDRTCVMEEQDAVQFGRML